MATLLSCFLWALLAPLICGQKYLIASYLDTSSNPSDPSNLLLSDIDFTGITHLIYGYASVSTDGVVSFRDKATAVDRLADPEELYCNCCLQGYVGALAKVKRSHPKLRTVLSVGDPDANGSAGLAAAASTAGGRATLASNLIKFAREYGFDGIDIGDLDPLPLEIPSLLFDIRAALNRDDVKDFSLSWGVSHDSRLDLARYDWAVVSASVDFVRVKWSSSLSDIGRTFRNPNSAKVDPQAQSSIPVQFRSMENSLTHFQQQTSIAKAKLVVTLDLTGLVYAKGEARPVSTGASQSDPAIISYKDIISQTQLDGNFAVIDNVFFYESDQKEVFVANTRANIQTILDVERTLGLKGIHLNHLGQDVLYVKAEESSRIAPNDFSTLYYLRDNLQDVLLASRSGNKGGCLTGSSHCNLRCGSCYEYSVARTCVQNGTLAMTFENGPSYLTPTFVSKLCGKSGQGSFFVNDIDLKDPVNAYSARRAMDGKCTVGLQLPSMGDLKQLTDENLRASLETSKLHFAASTAGKTPSMARIDVDENDPDADRVCKVINDAGLRMVSDNVDSLDYAYHTQQALYHNIVRHFDLGIVNATRPENTRPQAALRNVSFISRQADIYQANVEIWDDLMGHVVDRYKLNLKNMEGCLGAPAYSPGLLAAGKYCDASKLMLHCNLENSIHMTFQGGPNKEVLPQTLDALKETPDYKVSMFYDGGHPLLGDDWNREIIKRAFDEGHDVGHLLPNATVGILDTDNDITRHIFWREMQMRDLHFQEVLGFRPRRIMFESISDYKPGVCGALQDMGYEVVIPNIDSEMFNNDTFIPKLKYRFRKFSGWSWTQGSFIASQRLDQMKPATVKSGFAHLFGELGMTGLRPVSSTQCKTGRHDSIVAQRIVAEGYDEPYYACGDGVCFHFKETCSTCPQDCGSCEPAGKGQTPQDPFDAAPQEKEEKPGLSPYTNDDLDRVAVIILAVLGCIVVLLLTIFAIIAMFKQRSRALNFTTSVSTGNLRELD